MLSGNGLAWHAQDVRLTGERHILVSRNGAERAIVFIVRNRLSVHRPTVTRCSAHNAGLARAGRRRLGADVVQ